MSMSIAVITLAACNTGNDKVSQTSTDTTQIRNTEVAISDTSGNTVIDGNTVINVASDTSKAPAKDNQSVKEVVEHYLHIKNALVKDNGKDAASGGKQMAEAMAKIDKSTLSDKQKKVYEDVEADAKEHAEHISTNAAKISHQREHFDMLSQAVYDLVKAFPAGKTLYKDHCPMYNDGKGAIWLSETKEIKNPYYGKKMITCGSVKETIK